jgi:hypothetical protein
MCVGLDVENLYRANMVLHHLKTSIFLWAGGGLEGGRTEKKVKRKCVRLCVLFLDVMYVCMYVCMVCKLSVGLHCNILSPK